LRQDARVQSHHLTPYSHKHTIDDPIFEPFYTEAEKLNVPLMLHPATMAS